MSQNGRAQNTRRLFDPRTWFWSSVAPNPGVRPSGPASLDRVKATDRRQDADLDASERRLAELREEIRVLTEEAEAIRAAKDVA
jgi:hypothetical protein